MTRNITRALIVALCFATTMLSGHVAQASEAASATNPYRTIVDASRDRTFVAALQDFARAATGGREAPVDIPIAASDVAAAAGDLRLLHSASTVPAAVAGYHASAVRLADHPRFAAVANAVAGLVAAGAVRDLKISAPADSQIAQQDALFPGSKMIGGIVKSIGIAAGVVLTVVPAMITGIAVAAACAAALCVAGALIALAIVTFAITYAGITEITKTLEEAGRDEANAICTVTIGCYP